MSRRRGFTLIELLAVIGIISLILAILAPALSSARLRNKGLVCLTNLRSMAHGWQMYGDDHGDVSVPGRMYNAGGGTGNPANYYDVGNGMKYRPRWIATMGKYTGLYGFDPPVPEDDRQDYDHKLYQCPLVADRTDSRNHAYGYNYQFLGNARQSGGQFINFPVNRSHISTFAETVMAGDCIGTAAGFAEADRLPYDNNGTDYASLGNHAWSLDPPRLTAESDVGSGDAGSPRTALDNRHQGKSNVMYCDGHADSKTPEAVGYRRDATGMFILGGAAGPGMPFNSFFSGRGRDDDPPAAS